MNSSACISGLLRSQTEASDRREITTNEPQVRTGVEGWLVFLVARSLIVRDLPPSALLAIICRVNAMFLKQLVQALAGHAGMARGLRHIAEILSEQRDKILALDVLYCVGT